MNISLSADIEDFIRTQVKRGVYHNESEFVEKSLQLIIDMRKHLSEDIEEGLEDIKHGRFADPEEVYKQAKLAIDQA